MCWEVLGNLRRPNCTEGLLRSTQRPLGGCRDAGRGFGKHKAELVKLQVPLVRSPKDHINTTILFSCSKAQHKGIKEIMFCRMLVFTWSFEALLMVLLVPSGR